MSHDKPGAADHSSVEFDLSDPILSEFRTESSFEFNLFNSDLKKCHK